MRSKKARWFNLCCCPCSAIDACESSNGGCSSKAECRRTTPGNRACVCHAGYTGDGIVCLGKHMACLVYHTQENHRNKVSCKGLILLPLWPRSSSCWYYIPWCQRHLFLSYGWYYLANHAPLAAWFGTKSYKTTSSSSKDNPISSSLIHTYTPLTIIKTFRCCTTPPQAWFQKGCWQGFSLHQHNWRPKLRY